MVAAYGRTDRVTHHPPYRAEKDRQMEPKVTDTREVFQVTVACDERGFNRDIARASADEHMKQAQPGKWRNWFVEKIAWDEYIVHYQK